MRLVRYLDAFLPPVVEDSNVAKRPAVAAMSVALPKALAEKIEDSRSISPSNSKTALKYFLIWAGERGISDKPVRDVGRPEARLFRKYLMDRGIKGRTLNNYMDALRALWNYLIAEEIEDVAKNPWSKLKKDRVAPKKRRPYEPHERALVAEEIERTHYWLFRAVLMCYFCYIRPKEACRLQRKDFDLKTGVVNIPAEKAKMGKGRVATIPKSILHYFADDRFGRIPPSYFVLGRDWEPNPEKSLNVLTLFKAHRKVVDRLVAEGKIRFGDGLTLYSWKDTGISRHARKTSPLSTRDQAGHADFSQTLQYYHTEQVNPEYSEIQNDLQQED